MAQPLTQPSTLAMWRRPSDASAAVDGVGQGMGPGPETNPAKPDPAKSSPAEPDPAEGRWITAAQRGDGEAFHDLVRRHDRVVLGFARRLLRHPEDAQEAAQEVFLRLFRFLDRLDPTRPLRPWLYRVTVNVCHDLGRKQQRHGGHQSLDDAEAAGQLPRASRSDDPANRAEAREEHRMVLDALTTLAPTERSALVLRDLEGLSTPEVAEILGSTPTTVRSQISRARLKIHRYRDRWLLQAAPQGSEP